MEQAKTSYLCRRTGTRRAVLFCWIVPLGEIGDEYFALVAWVRALGRGDLARLGQFGRRYRTV